MSEDVWRHTTHAESIWVETVDGDYVDADHIVAVSPSNGGRVIVELANGSSYVVACESPAAFLCDILGCTVEED